MLPCASDSGRPPGLLRLHGIIRQQIPILPLLPDEALQYLCCPNEESLTAPNNAAPEAIGVDASQSCCLPADYPTPINATLESTAGADEEAIILLFLEALAEPPCLNLSTAAKACFAGNTNANVIHGAKAPHGAAQNPIPAADLLPTHNAVDASKAPAASDTKALPPSAAIKSTQRLASVAEVRLGANFVKLTRQPMFAQHLLCGDGADAAQDHLKALTSQIAATACHAAAQYDDVPALCASFDHVLHKSAPWPQPTSLAPKADEECHTTDADQLLEDEDEVIKTFLEGLTAGTLAPAGAHPPGVIEEASAEDAFLTTENLLILPMMAIHFSSTPHQS